MAIDIPKEMGEIKSKSKNNLFLHKELKLMQDMFQSVEVKQTA